MVQPKILIKEHREKPSRNRNRITAIDDLKEMNVQNWWRLVAKSPEMWGKVIVESIIHPGLSH